MDPTVVDARRAARVPVQLILAAVLALVALGTYFFRTEENPITGQRERTGGISTLQETQLGQNAAPQMVQQMGGAHPPTSPKAQFLAALGQRLLDAGGASERLRAKNVPWQFTFTLLDDDETVNAFALPGGPVFMTEALLNRLENEAQVAGVIGHEIGHVFERHGTERMARSQLGQGLVGAVAVGASGEQGGMIAAQAAQFVNGYLQLSYSRDQELQSDALGLQMMADAGYDPREMVRVMEILEEASGGGRSGVPEWQATHPQPKSRIRDIEAWVKAKFPQGVPSELTKGRSLR